MRNTGVLPTDRLARVPRQAGATLAFVLAVVIGLLAGDGWLYLLRDAGWLGAGPKVGESLPLLQLAGFDAQPLLRLAVAWLLAGALTGLALVWVRPAPRAVLAGSLALLLLLAGSQAAYALTRNLRFTDILFTRSPGLGPWLEALLFAVGGGSARRSILRGQRSGAGPRGVRRLVGLRDLGLRGSELRHAGQHDRDRPQMGDDCEGIRA